MPARRFLKLDPKKRDQILDAACAEFSAHGYAAASQNRIIKAAGVSKGAMYYYFDDKEDLFVTMVHRKLAGLAEVIGLGVVDTIEQFWAQLDEMFMRFMALLEHSPQTAALVRTLVRTFPTYGAPRGMRALLDKARAVTEQIVVRGQEVGAVRQDLRTSLLVDIAMKAGEAMDFWFAEHWRDLDPAELPELNRKLVGIFRRIAQPRRIGDSAADGRGGEPRVRKIR
ncbi:MAG: TetR/AcrR family transcriptional regulator [Deltaproteobacteria bacterium]|nr:MAG: TetR/AcrR family transcriptional regulator [Deltaproteobacteria bacterium]